MTLSMWARPAHATSFFRPSSDELARSASAAGKISLEGGRESGREGGREGGMGGKVKGASSLRSTSEYLGARAVCADMLKRKAGTILFMWSRSQMFSPIPSSFSIFLTTPLSPLRPARRILRQTDRQTDRVSEKEA